jgi:hypothetical protein
VTVDDLWIDVIVGPPDLPYRMLDLHEYAAAMASGALDNHRRLTSRRSLGDVTAIVRCFSIYAPVRRAHDRCSRWG